MRRKPKKRRVEKPKARLRLPDLDQSKAAVIGSLRSPESQRGYKHARRIHRVVLFRTQTLVQSNGRVAVPNSFGIPEFGSRHHKCQVGCCPAIGIRSFRRWFA
jgi:hypothetical protein